MVYCPECETNLDLEEDEVDEGEVVSCPECGSDFEVITVNPIELKPVEEEYEEDEEEEAEDGDYASRSLRFSRCIHARFARLPLPPPPDCAADLHL